MDSVASPQPLALDRPPPAPAAVRPEARGRSVALAALLGWLMPGLGHVYVGQPLKGLLFFAAIVPTFALGLALTDFTCVNPQKYTLEFVAHAWVGGPTAAAMQVTKDHLLQSMPRWFDVGRLYAAIAGLLNVVVLSDVIGAALRRNRIALHRRRRLEHALHGGCVEMLPGDVLPGEAAPAPALAELDRRESLFSALEDGPLGGHGAATAPPTFPAIPGDPLLETQDGSGPPGDPEAPASRAPTAGEGR